MTKFAVKGEAYRDLLDTYKKRVKELQDDNIPFTYVLTHNAMRRIEDFADLDREYKRCKDPSKGRRISNAYVAVSDTGEYVTDSYTIRLHSYTGEPICRLSRDNTMEFIAENDIIWSHSQTLSCSFANWFQFLIWRHRTGLYRVIHLNDLEKQSKANALVQYQNAVKQMEASTPDDFETVDCHDDGTKWYEIRHGDQLIGWSIRWRTCDDIMRTAPQYVKGLKFNAKGVCLNRKEDDTFIEIPDKRREWRKMLSKFKKGIKARGKVGAFDAIIKETEKKLSKDGTSWSLRHKAPNWQSSKWIEFMADCMEHNKFPKDLIVALYHTSRADYNSFYNKTELDSDSVVQATNKLLKHMSIDLRRHFNVFKKEGHHVKSSMYWYGYDTPEQMFNGDEV